MPDPKNAIASKSPSLSLARFFDMCLCVRNKHTHTKHSTVNEHNKTKERERDEFFAVCFCYCTLRIHGHSHFAHTYAHSQIQRWMDGCRYYTYSWCCYILRCLNNNGEFATLDIHSHSQIHLNTKAQIH